MTIPRTSGSMTSMTDQKSINTTSSGRTKMRRPNSVENIRYVAQRL
jgi:hypothetical protein